VSELALAVALTPWWACTALATLWIGVLVHGIP
jgi:hypothetical protein